MRGFTLLEVLISVAILVIITGVVYSAFTSNIAAVDIAREQSISNQTARVILDQMTKEFESMYILPKDDHQDVLFGIEGIDREIDGRPADTVNFTTLSGTRISEDGMEIDLREVGYQVDAKEEDQSITTENGKPLVLFRREDNIIDDSITDGGSTYEMADNIVELDITYKDIDGNEFEDWDSLEGDREGMLPHLIVIRLVIREKSGKEDVYTTSVHPMLSGANSDK